MALGECRECGKQVSDEAKNCPHCGVSKPVKSGIGPVKLFMLLGIGALIFANIMPSNDGAKRSVSTAAPAQKSEKTPEQLTAERKKELTFQKTVLAAATVKRAMRDPDSLVWEDILASDDASVICLQYRAKNGFGGMNREFVVYANGTASQKTADWNKHCRKSMLDMKHVKYALK